MKQAKLMAALFFAAMLAGCSPAESQSARQTSPAAETTAESSAESASESETKNALDAIGNVEVDAGLFDVELTIPSDLVEFKTQAECDALAKERGYQSITLNEDGSATYIMTKKQHKALMAELKESLHTSLEGLVGSESYPNFTSVKANEDFTEFEVTTKSTELSMSESFSVIAFYMYGGMYNVFNGTSVDNISVKFINADTGAEISTSNSKDIGNES